jgi:hypothetical protein
MEPSTLQTLKDELEPALEVRDVYLEDTVKIDKLKTSALQQGRALTINEEEIQESFRVTVLIRYTAGLVRNHF